MSEGVTRRTWLPLALLHLLWTGWLLTYPVSLDSDDALNFAHGVVRFSVLEFAPHFPGYPAFIALARLVNLFAPSPEAAVQWAALLGSAGIAPLGAWLALRLFDAPRLLAPLWLALLALPLTPALALSGLSDGPALAAWLAALLALTHGRAALTGLLLGLLLALRPSYAVLMVLPLWLLWAPPKAWGLGQAPWRRALPPFVLVGLGCLAFVWQADGAAYFSEGARFTSGHFTLWGNTASAHASRLVSWYLRFNHEFTPLWPLLLWPLWRGASQLTPALRLPITASWQLLLGWTLMAQNPDNARHLAPLALLSLVLIAAATPPRIMGIIALLVLGVSWREPAPSPSAQALTVASRECHTLVTHWGVRLAREQTTLPVVDAWYQGDAERALARGACRLSRAAPSPGKGQVWHFSRLPAEPALWLSVLPSSQKQAAPSPFAVTLQGRPSPLP